MSVEYVINYEIPNVAETYVHRIGRTGRAGANGTAYSFCDHEEKAYIKDIEKLISKKIPLAEENPYPMGTAPEKEVATTPHKPSQNTTRTDTAKPKKKWFGKPKTFKPSK